jgi:hypothetical protein
MMRPPAGNALRLCIVTLVPMDMICTYCRMVWEDCCTSGTKLGSRKVELFTTDLISRVFVSKPSKLLVLKSQNEKYDNNP